MNVTLTNNNGNGKITVAVEENDYKGKVEDGLKKIRRERNFPGFRPGTVPLGHVRRLFEKDMTHDVINNVVYEAVTNYIRDNKVDVLGQPIPVSAGELDYKNQKDFTFEYEVAIAPAIDLGVNKDMHVPYYDIEVSDKMVDDQDEAFRKRFGKQEPGPEFEPDALVKGVMMELNEDGTVKEGEDAIQVTNGIVAPMYFKSKEEAEKFNGCKPESKVVFNPWNSCEGNLAELSSMLNIDKEKAADVHSNFEMAVSEIIVVKPAELNQEYYDQIFGTEEVEKEDGTKETKHNVTNEEEYRAELKNMIGAELKNNSDGFFRAEFQKLLTEKFAGLELPAETLKKWILMVNKDQTPETIDSYYQEILPSLRWEIIESRLHEEFNVEVKEDDLVEAARNVAARQFAQYGMTNIDDEVVNNYAKQMLSDKKFAQNLYGRIADAKLYAAVKDAVTLDNHSISLDDFKALVEKFNHSEESIKEEA